MKKRISAILLALVMMLSVLPMSVFTASADDTAAATEALYFNYEALSDTEAIIQSYYGKDSAVKIPSTIDGYTVSAIGMEAFAYNEIITSVTIPAGVWLIEPNAFYGCVNLTEVYYQGTTEERDAMEIGEGNECLTDNAYWSYAESGSADCEHNYMPYACSPTTCTEDSIQTYRCLLCGDSYSEVVSAALGHNYQEKINEDGTVTRFCIRCGDGLESSGGSDTEEHTHTYEIYEVAATCQLHGSKTYVCFQCGDYYSEDIVCNGHNYQEMYNENGKLVAVMCVSCGDVSEAYGAGSHDHAYKTFVVDASCEIDGTRTSSCTECGASYTETISATGHDFSAYIIIDGLERAVCVNCGALSKQDGGDDETCNHSYDEGRVSVSATCTSDGVMIYSCYNCGEAITEKIPATGHNYKEIVTSNGVEIVCTICGEGRVDDEACTHSYQVSKTDATCTKDGSIKYTCTLCEYYYIITTPATGHNYDYISVDGMEMYACTYCGEAGGTGEHTHDYASSVIIKASTCTKNGIKQYTCTGCGETITEEIPAFGHNYEEQKNEDGTVTVVCTNCGETSESSGEEHVHSYVERGYAATCETDGFMQYTCLDCGYSYSESTPALGHNYEYITVDGKEVYACTNCGDGSNSGDSGESGGEEHEHTYEVYEIPATCEADGRTTYVCYACGDYYIETIYSIGHDYQEMYNDYGYVVMCVWCGDVTKQNSGCSGDHAYKHFTVNPTCEAQGHTTTSCTDCGVSYTETYYATGHNYSAYLTIDGVEVAVCTNCGEFKESDGDEECNHSYVITEEIASTCTTNGSVTYFCNDCGDTKTETIYATGHNFENIVTAEGVKIYACTYCGEEGNAEEHYHDYTSSEIIKASTCTENGIKQYTCTGCGETIIEEIPAYGHNYEYTTIDGMKVYACTYCGELGESGGDDGEHTHSYEVIRETSATCTTDGIRIYSCVDCGETKTETIPAFGHDDYGCDIIYENVVEATCTEEGYYDEVYHCTVCGEETYRETMTEDALGHKFDSGYESKRETCTEDGEMIAVCENGCGATESIIIPATGHNFEYIIVNGEEKYVCTNCGEVGESDGGEDHECEYTARRGEDPTCTEDGFVEYACDCGESYTEDIPATGHTEVIIPGIDPTETEDGLTEGVECSVCGEILMEQEIIPATGNGDSGSDDEDDQEETDPNAPQIVIESKSVSAGNQIELSVVIKNNPGFSWLSLTPELPSELELVKVKNGILASDFTSGLNLVWAADEDVSADGILMTFVFKVSDSVEPGDYEININFNESYNNSEEDVSFTMFGGTITVLDFEYGDANGDGSIDGKDVVRLKNYLANYNYSTGISTVQIFDGADANGDGEVDGKDVIRLKKYLANYNYDTDSSTVVLGPQS